LHSGGDLKSIKKKRQALSRRPSLFCSPRDSFCKPPSEVGVYPPILWVCDDTPSFKEVFSPWMLEVSPQPFGKLATLSGGNFANRPLVVRGPPKPKCPFQRKERFPQKGGISTFLGAFFREEKTSTGKESKEENYKKTGVKRELFEKGPLISKIPKGSLNKPLLGNSYKWGGKD